MKKTSTVYSMILNHWGGKRPPCKTITFYSAITESLNQKKVPINYDTPQ